MPAISAFSPLVIQESLLLSESFVGASFRVLQQGKVQYVTRQTPVSSNQIDSRSVQ